MSAFRTYLYLLFVSLLFSCKPDSPPAGVLSWTDAEKKKYFQDSIAYWMYNARAVSKDSLNEFPVFARTLLSNSKSKTRNTSILYALDEPYIDTTTITSHPFWFRITVCPSFSKPYCLTLEKKGGKAYLTAKQTDGKGGYFSGMLETSVTQLYPDSLCRVVAQHLHQLRLWQLPKHTDCTGLDGETWMIEAIDKGKYALIYRWLPFDCGDKTTQTLVYLHNKLLKDSQLEKYTHLTQTNSLTPN